MREKFLEFIGKKLRPVELRLGVKWLLNIKRRRVKLPDGSVYEIDPISDLGHKLINNGQYEIEMTKIIKGLLQKGDCFIDLGANEGFFTVMAGNLVSSEGRVFAIEPQRRLWTVVYQNVMLNDLYNVQLLPYGIGSSIAEVDLQLYPTTNSGATSYSESYNFKIAFSSLRRKLYGRQHSRVKTLNALLTALPETVKLIKIDIEGYEFEALQGATELLKTKRILNLLIEIHHEALSSMAQSEAMIDDFLAQFNYHKKQITSVLSLYSAA